MKITIHGMKHLYTHSVKLTSIPFFPYHFVFKPLNSTLYSLLPDQISPLKFDFIAPYIRFRKERLLLRIQPLSINVSALRRKDELETSY